VYLACHDSPTPAAAAFLALVEHFLQPAHDEGAHARVWLLQPALQELPMSASLFALLMLAAFLHASWNTLIKAAASAWFGTVLVAGSASLLAMCALPWLPAPAMASWPYIAASVALQVLYLWLIARSYRVADMGRCTR
jgi:hypothetical protein